MGLFDKCRQFTRARDVAALGVYPYFHPIEASEATTVVIGGKRLVMIGSNNYLGLTQDPRVKAAAVRAVEKYGSGCTGSRFLNGTLDLHEELEHRLAKFVRKEKALLFSTGFQTNLGTISVLVGKDDVILCDRMNRGTLAPFCALTCSMSG